MLSSWPHSARTRARTHTLLAPPHTSSPEARQNPTNFQYVQGNATTQTRPSHLASSAPAPVASVWVQTPRAIAPATNESRPMTVSPRYVFVLWAHSAQA